AVRAIREAWERIEQAVWGFLREHAPSVTDETARQWREQVGGVWEIAWAVGDGTLDQRKNLRDFGPSERSGEKCTVCGERSALHAGNGDRKSVQEFWARLAVETRDHAHFTFSQEGRERLCAVCTVKRLLPFVNALDWPLPWTYPST